MIRSPKTVRITIAILRTRCIILLERELLISAGKAVTKEEAEEKLLELEGVKEAEAGRFDQALEIFSRAVELCPKSASAYNNRAQVYRLKYDIESW